MKKLIVFLLASLMIYSCDSPKKALQRGSYEQACILAIKKLQKNLLMQKTQKFSQLHIKKQIRPIWIELSI